EDVDRELVVELARGDAVARGGDALGLVRVEEPKLGVGARGGGLDPPEPARYGRRNRLAGDGKVLDRLPRLGAPELLPLGGGHGLSLATRSDWPFSRSGRHGPNGRVRCQAPSAVPADAGARPHRPSRL